MKATLNKGKYVCYLLIVLSFICYTQTYSQTLPVYKLTENSGDTINLQNQLLVIQKRYEKQMDELPRENRKKIKEIYKDVFENVKSMFDKGELVNNTVAVNYLQKMTDKIISANPALQSIPINVYFSKSMVPNAYSVGFGVLIFNAGLFTKLDNESQVAYVLGHELSHIYFQHVDKGIEHYINTLYSDEVQKKLREINKQVYKQGEALEKLGKGFVFNNKRHTRDHEQQADSMSLVFLKPTNFDVKEALTALGILDTIDNFKINTEGVLEKAFNNPGYPFKKSWLNKEEGLLGGHAVLKKEKELEDSMKTHPDCKARIKALHGVVSSNINASRLTNPVNQPLFKQIQKWAPYQIIDYYYKNKLYCPALYQSLELIEKENINNKVVCSVGCIFNELYAAQKKHQLGNYIEMPAPGYSKDYNTLLQFVNNLYLEDYAGIGFHFLSRYQQQYSSDKDFQSAYSNSQKNTKN